MIRFPRAVLLAGLLSLLSACAAPAVRADNASSAGRWGLRLLLDRLATRKDAVHTFLVYREGRLSAVWSAPGYDAAASRPLYSVTKSVVSLLCGIAVGEGRLRLDDPVCKYFPAFTNNGESGGATPDSRPLVTVRHLLTMTSGLNRDEESVSACSDATRLDRVLRLPLGGAPGSIFCYHNGSAHLLGAIVAKSVGMPLDEYAKIRLFDPLGIRNWSWNKEYDGAVPGDTGLCLSPNDLAKIGMMLLEGGSWRGRCVVPAGWLKQATSRQVEGWPYGYLWWMNTFGGFRAQGRHGQYLFVLPEKHEVIVFTGDLPDGDIGLPVTWVKKYLISVE
jgi:CubicO group peptidase (beta-lactamase class C family)